MNKIQKLFLSLASLLLTIWLFGLVWSASSFASDNIMNAVEASAPDTVTPEIWMEITFGTLGLVAAFSALTNTIPLKIFSIFRWWEKPLVFGAPLSGIALSPLLGVPTPLLSCALIIVCVMLRSERIAKVRSTSPNQEA